VKIKPVVNLFIKITLMKTRFTIHALLFYFILVNTYAQVPQAIPYQAVARNNAGELITNQSVSLMFSIHDSTLTGTVVYRETHNATTNALGLFTVNIGQGTPVTGTFISIDWGTNSKFIQVEMDTAGGSTYTDMGTQQMLSVPYALNAGNVNWNKAGSVIYNANNGNVGIGTPSPASSAQLEVSSTNKGFLLPRMTVAERNAINNPVAGLQIWCIDCNQLQVYDGTVWQNITHIEANFPSVTICSQEWADKNLDVATYRNGDPIPQVTDPAAWGTLTTGAYCYYNNDSATYGPLYGKLYNWFAVNDPRGLAPEGWHIPSDAEWGQLEACLGGALVAGGALKATGVFWNSPNTGATNSSGFTSLPGGYRSFDGLFNFIGNYGDWWSSTQFNATNARDRYMSYNNSNLSGSNLNKNYGLSVRCIRD
jgi:uncharacterized protein (TIGR02145 family)